MWCDLMAEGLGRVGAKPSPRHDRLTGPLRLHFGHCRSEEDVPTPHEKGASDRLYTSVGNSVDNLSISSQDDHSEMFPGLYSEKRAAQSVAYFLHLAGGELNLLKLTKLLYLAERLSYEKYGEPLTGDSPFSMEHGPVLSVAYDSTKFSSSPRGVEWVRWVAGRSANDVRLARNVENPQSELTSLSAADFGVMGETWTRFGHLTEWELRDYTHEHCPEWEDPGKSSRPIDPDDLLTSIGFSPEEIVERKASLREIGRVNRTFISK